MYGIILLIALSWSMPQDTILPSGGSRFNSTALEYDTIPDSMNMQFMGNWPYGPALHVYVVKNIAFLAAGGVVYILNVSDPYHPVKMSEIKTMGVAARLFYDRGFLYIAGGDIGLDIWNVMNLLSPYEVARYKVDDYAKDVVVEGNYAYLLGDSTLHIIDVSVPVAPVEVGSYYITHYRDFIANRVFVSGNYAYISTYFRLIVLDITNPEEPSEISAFTPVSAWDNKGVFVQDTFAYVADFNSLHILDISDPAHINEVGRYSLPNYNLRDVWVSGIYAYVIAPESLLIIDVSSPSQPRMVMSVHVPIFANSLFLNGNFVFIAANGAGLQVFNISDIRNSEKIETYSAYPTFDRARGIFLQGNYAYVADGYAGLVILDVSDITNPVLVGQYDTPGYAMRVYVSGNYAYVADSYGGLRIIDVSDVTYPREVGHYQTPGYARDVIVVDSIAYVIDSESGLLIFNVSDPSNPVEISSCDIPGETNRLSVYQYCGRNFVFVSTDSGIRQIDISDIHNPRDLGFCYLAGGPTYGLISTTNYNCSRWVIYAAAYDRYALHFHTALVRIEELHPQIWRASDFDRTLDLTIHGGAVVVSDRYAGIIAYRGSGATQEFVIIGYYNTPGYAYSLVATGLYRLYILVADGYGGVQIYRYATENVSENTNTGDGNEFDLNFMSPMQFDIRFAVPSGEMVKLQLFDVSGREVWSGNFGPGVHRVQQNVPSGVYLLKLTGGASSIMRKLLVIKN